MADLFKDHVSGLESPPRFARAVTPSDSADLPQIPRALYINTAGEIVAILEGDADDAAQTYTVVVGQILVGHWRRVLATGTTSTNLIAWW